MTARERAIAALRTAMGDRPWILVYDKRHSTADASDYHVEGGGSSRDMHAALGLLAVGRLTILRDLWEPGDPGASVADD